MKVRESEEMYLETILILKRRNANVHAIDIASDLGYAKSSVSRAVNLLQDKGYITIDKSGLITLTDLGTLKANDIYDRHRVITDLLMRVGADRELAEDNACRIEHVISPELFTILKKFTEKQ
ncbi:MAG: metal-dependent transcriptional regulator [Clostridiales bacterium]|nr:metal-dependent transcriptional regulator [Clostridiales bacterium]